MRTYIEKENHIGLSVGKILLTDYRLLTDRQTEIQTDRQTDILLLLYKDDELETRFYG